MRLRDARKNFPKLNIVEYFEVNPCKQFDQCLPMHFIKIKLHMDMQKNLQASQELKKSKTDSDPNLPQRRGLKSILMAY